MSSSGIAQISFQDLLNCSSLPVLLRTEIPMGELSIAARKNCSLRLRLSWALTLSETSSIVTTMPSSAPSRSESGAVLTDTNAVCPFGSSSWKPSLRAAFPVARVISSGRSVFFMGMPSSVQAFHPCRVYEPVERALRGIANIVSAMAFAKTILLPRSITRMPAGLTSAMPSRSSFSFRRATSAATRWLMFLTYSMTPVTSPVTLSISGKLNRSSHPATEPSAAVRGTTSSWKLPCSSARMLGQTAQGSLRP